MRSRISTRAFLREKEVPQEVLEDILAIASRAPSGGNTQPWHLYALAGEPRDQLCKAGVAAVRKHHEPEYSVYASKETAPQQHLPRRQKIAYDMYALMGVERKDGPARMRALARNFEFFDAPVAIIVTVDRACDRNAWGHVGMLLQSICLLAEERGLATCLLEAWGNLGRTVYEELGIPDTEIVWCGLAVGYADPDAPVNRLCTERVPVTDFAHIRGFSSKL